MIKKVLIYFIAPALFFVSCISTADKDTGKYDERAIECLDNLSETIGDLNSCSYTLNTIVSESDNSEFSNEHDVYMRGPDKMYVHSNGTKGLRGFWYNGSSFAYFSYDKNVYDTVAAPENIIAAIDFLHGKYEIDFPAADFFYPSLTDDIIENYNQVYYLGKVKIDDIDCIALEASNKDKVLQIWIKKISKLPHKIIIASQIEDGNYYEAVFSNWKVNPELPDLLFEFEPPVNSTRVKLQAKN